MLNITGINLDEPSSCFDYLPGIQCAGGDNIVYQEDNMDLDSPSSPTYNTSDGWGMCASLCIGKVRENRFADSLNGVFNSIAFNWIGRGNGQSTCQCLRAVC